MKWNEISSQDYIILYEYRLQPYSYHTLWISFTILDEHKKVIIFANKITLKQQTRTQYMKIPQAN